MEKILDELITNPSDELYSLQSKYGIKISRSSSSDAIYIYKTKKGFKVRIGHPISKNQVHIQNFAVNVNESHPHKPLVESIIKKYLNSF